MSKPAYIPIVSKFDPKGVNDAEGGLNKLKSGLGKIAGAIAGAFAVGQVVNFAKSAILAAENVQVADNRIGAIAKSMDLFGAQTGEVSNRLIDFAESKELQLGIDAELIKAGQAQLLTFKNLAQSADETGGMFDRATVASADLAAAGFGSIDSASIMLGKALNDPIKGITALGRAGVQFSEDQKALIKSFVDTGDLASAQNLIMQEVETQVGGTAAATVKATDRMKLAFENVSEQVGGILLPHFERMTDFLIEKVMPKVDEFFKTFEQPIPDPGQQARVTIPELEAKEGQSPGDFIKNMLDEAIAAIKDWFASGGFEDLITSVMEMGVKIREAIITNLPMIIQTLVDILMQALPIALNTLVTLIPIIIQQLTTILTETLPQIFQTLIGMIPMLIDTAIEFFMGLVDALVTVVPLLIGALVEMIPQLVTSLVTALPLIIEGAIQLFLGLLDGLLLALPALLIAVIEAVPVIVESLLGALPLIVEGAIQLFTGLITGLIQFLPQMGITFMTEVLPALIVAIIDMLPEIITTAPRIILAIITGIVDSIPQLVQAFKDLIPKMKESILEAVPKMLEAGKDILDGLINGIITDGPRLIWEAMQGLGESIVNGINDILDISSPSKVMAESGKWIGLGLVDGIESQTSAVNQAAQDLADSVNVGIKDGLGMTIGISSSAEELAQESISGLLDFGVSADVAYPGAISGESSQTFVEVTINAGVGTDPVSLGREVVNAIKRYESVSGRVFLTT